MHIDYEYTNNIVVPQEQRVVDFHCLNVLTIIHKYRRLLDIIMYTSLIQIFH